MLHKKIKLAEIWIAKERALAVSHLYFERLASLHDQMLNGIKICKEEGRSQVRTKGEKTKKRQRFIWGMVSCVTIWPHKLGLTSS